MNIVPDTFNGLAGPEIELFKKLLADVGGEGVEIGCLDGFSSVVILEFSKLRLTSIDPFVPDSMEASLIGQKSRYLANVAPYGDRAALIQGFSQDVIIQWDKPLDFLFVDGDHNHSAVLRDYYQWTPVLKVGGLFALHDSRMSRPGGANFHPGPSQVAFDQVFSRPELWEVVGEAFSLTVARKLQ
jgi:predicted O-methyltransferase YrrM